VKSVTASALRRSPFRRPATSVVFEKIGRYTMRCMSARGNRYRWWLLDGDFDVVSDGSVAGITLFAALADLNREIHRLGRRGKRPTNRPYSLIVYKGDAVVAVRPSTLGIC
jgi:hypothetical protein